MADGECVGIVASGRIASAQTTYSCSNMPSPRSVRVHSDASTSALGSIPASDSCPKNLPVSVATLPPRSPTSPPSASPARPDPLQDLNGMPAIEDVSSTANGSRSSSSIRPIVKGSIRSHYSVIRRIGRGRFGSVYEALDRTTNTRVAIKSIPKARQSVLPTLIGPKVTEADVARQQRLVESEAEISLMLGSAGSDHPDVVNTGGLLAALADITAHRIRDVAGAAVAETGVAGRSNVVQVLSVMEGRRHFHIVMELCQGGSLADFLEKRQRGQVVSLAAVSCTASPVPTSAVIRAVPIHCPLHPCEDASSPQQITNIASGDSLGSLADGDRSPAGLLGAESRGNGTPSAPAPGAASDAESSPGKWYQTATWESKSDELGEEEEGMVGLESADRDWRRRMRCEERVGESERDVGRESGRGSEFVEGGTEEDGDFVASRLEGDWAPRKALTGKGMEKSASTGELVQLAEAAAAAAASFAGRGEIGGSVVSSTSAVADSAGAGRAEGFRVRSLVYGGMTEEGKRRQQEWEDEAAWIVSEIAVAVAYCHKRGILHRDIKPENILLTLPPGSQPIIGHSSSPAAPVPSSQDQSFRSACAVGRSVSMKPSSEFLCSRTPSFSSLSITVAATCAAAAAAASSTGTATAVGSGAVGATGSAGAADYAGGDLGTEGEAGAGISGRPAAATNGRERGCRLMCRSVSYNHQAASQSAVTMRPPHGADIATIPRGNGWGHRRSASLANWLGRSSLRKQQKQQQQQEPEPEQQQQPVRDDGIKGGPGAIETGLDRLPPSCTCTCQQHPTQSNHQPAYNSDGNTPSHPVIQFQGLRLADFGLAEKLSPGKKATRGLVGSPAYVAPELAAGLPVSFPADVWGIGICLYMVLSGGQLPFSGRRTRLLLLNIRRAQLPMGSAVWASVSGEAKEVVRRLLAAKPENRPSAEEVLQMPWVVRGRERWLARQQALTA